MECPRCHNKNVNRFYKVNGQYYCRYCIRFSRVFVGDKLFKGLDKSENRNVEYFIPFELSHQQKLISDGLKENYIHHRNSLVLAVCGSGKTEIVFELIAYALNQGDRVCYCVPRQELCKELYQRFSSHFKNVEMSLIYGGHIDNLENPFIICTTHQLYRFEKSGFHLIILDEADAFPFYHNQVLEEIFKNCVRGQYVKLSATLSKEDITNEKLFIMNRRYHNHDLPLPYIKVLPSFLLRYYLLYFLHQTKKVLIFVPTLHDCEWLTPFLKKFHFKVAYVHSKSTNNSQKLQQLKDGQLDAIVTTTLLERGITIKNVQVIVYQANHPVFTSRTLIQIAGRVGRKPDAYEGKVCFLSESKTKEMKKCIYTINKLNGMNV